MKPKKPSREEYDKAKEYVLRKYSKTLKALAEDEEKERENDKKLHKQEGNRK